MQSDITVPDGTVGVRLDRFCLEHFEQVSSRNQARKAIKRRASAKRRGVRIFDCCASRRHVVSLLRPPPLHGTRFLSWKSHVVFEDEHVAVVNKPTGLIVNGNRYRTLQNCLRPDSTPCSEEDALPLPRPCHRLDAQAGGLVVVAKSHRALVKMGRLFERKVEKRYRAIVVGELVGDGEVLSPVEGRNAHTRCRAISHNRALKTRWQTTVDL